MPLENRLAIEGLIIAVMLRRRRPDCWRRGKDPFHGARERSVLEFLSVSGW